LPLGWKLDVFAITVLASDGYHVLATRFFFTVSTRSPTAPSR